MNESVAGLFRFGRNGAVGILVLAFFGPTAADRRNGEDRDDRTNLGDAEHVHSPKHKQNEPTGNPDGSFGQTVSLALLGFLGRLDRARAAATAANGDDGESEDGGENEQLLHQRLPKGGLNVGRKLHECRLSRGTPDASSHARHRGGGFIPENLKKLPKRGEYLRNWPLLSTFGRSGNKTTARGSHW